ncbi:NAD-dependent epimerase/dehydratase family protein [Mycobacterium sp. IS-1742]|uniref:NAD-dependent epimerase/dehydratase family protein n=1 Tax=Mycobacterium sp. IS-1742 TaxID=1772285 RepID=UPI001E5925A6|nr:NAD-dependent epimerase/dehydratase family protein [Mycobacterium sp. IS-1742]
MVTGASGNVGTGVLRALARQLPDAEVVGVCRRPPTHGQPYERVRWHAVDLSAPSAAADLELALRGADVVVHLALAVHPVRDEDYLYRANVRGTQALLDAMTAAGVGQLVYASSLGIYAPGSGPPVTEDWPTTGQATSVYSRHKVMVERILDRFELDHPEATVSRFRPTVVVQREAAWLIKSLYLGPLVPTSVLGLLRRRELPVLPVPGRLELQFVHADDVGDAVVRLITQQVRGSFNIAADVLDTAALAALVGARPVTVPPQAVRTLIAALSAVRVVALTPGWYDVAFKTPLMDTSKARRTLGWTPAWSSTDSARELIEGLADGAVGTSEAMGWELRPRRDVRGAIDRAHDVTLGVWGALAVLRAVGGRRARAVDAAVVASNLASGTPMALDRVFERRTDPVALLAPVAVVAALGATVRGGWPAVAATGVLQVLRVSERRRRATKLVSDAEFSAASPG